jgi:hypothetical protein
MSRGPPEGNGVKVEQEVSPSTMGPWADRGPCRETCNYRRYGVRGTRSLMAQFRYRLSEMLLCKILRDSANMVDMKKDMYCIFPGCWVQLGRPQTTACVYCLPPQGPCTHLPQLSCLPSDQHARQLEPGSTSSRKSSSCISAKRCWARNLGSAQAAAN